MNLIIWLEAEGFQVIFDISEINDDFLKASISLSFNTDMNRGSLKIQDDYLEKSDLLNLANYFEKHIVSLEGNPDHDSDTFVSRELTFQARALCGEIRNNSDGEFTILFMLNIGKSRKEKINVYAGCEGMVSLEKIKTFIQLIRRFSELN